MNVQAKVHGNTVKCPCSAFATVGGRTCENFTSRSDIHKENKLVKFIVLVWFVEIKQVRVNCEVIWGIVWDGHTTGTSQDVSHTSTNCPAGRKKMYETGRCDWPRHEPITFQHVTRFTD